MDSFEYLNVYQFHYAHAYLRNGSIANGVLPGSAVFTLFTNVPKNGTFVHKLVK